MDEERRENELLVGSSSGDEPAREVCVSPHEEPARLVAAWDAAGPVTRANWMLQIAVLKLDQMDVMCFQAGLNITHLAVRAMDLVGSVVGKDALRDAIRRAWSESEFVDERRSELLERTAALHREAEPRLREHRRDPDEFMRVHEEECRKIIAPCRSLIAKIESKLESCMTERQNRVYRLGRMLEQVTSRDDVFKETALWFTPVEDGGKYEPPKYFAAGRPQVSGVGTLSPFWLDELKTRMRDCGLPEAIGPPKDDLWLRGADHSLRVRLEKEGVTKFSINEKLKEYQLSKFMARIRQEFLYGGESGSSAPGDLEGRLAERLEDPTSERPDAPRILPDRNEGRCSSGLTLAPAERTRLLKIKAEIDPAQSYVGESAAILKVFERINQLNKTPEKPVLILGPTGAGKTEIAELIHQHSKRPGQFLREQASDNKMNDFGFIKGRWVGYGKSHGVANVDPNGTDGILIEASGGTVFIDELGDLSWEFQGFLRDLLDRKEIPKVLGQRKPVVPNMRLIFATNVNIEDAVREKQLRHDLVDRIKLYSLTIPTLCERKEDILLFVARKCGGFKIIPSFRLALLQHSWPGNVRELLSILELAKSKSKNMWLTFDDLEFDASSLSTLRAQDENDAEGELYKELVDILGQRGFVKGKGLYKEMARLLGVSEPTVSRKAEKYLDPE